MRKLALAIGALLAVLISTSSADAEVRVTIRDGHVSISAKDATARQILTEWARVGQTKIVNVERIPGGPLTLELSDVPEQQALDVLLRAVSGYLVAPRAVAVANASVFDRIVVMATTVAPTAPVTAAGGPIAPPAPSLPPRPVFDDGDDDRPFPPVPVPGQGRSPVFAIPPPPVTSGQMPPVTAMPINGQGPPPVSPQAGSASPTRATTFPGAPTSQTPAGSSVPGMVVPAPQQPNGQPVPVFPGQPQ